MQARLDARWWFRVVGPCVIMVSFSPIARSDDDPTAKPPSTANPAPAARSASPQPAPTSMEELAARLRAMEEMNKKLADRLEKTTIEHNEQMKQILEKYADLSKRLREGKEGEGQVGVDQVAVSAPTNNGQVADQGSPVPDYTEGQFAPFMPAPGYPLSK